jgi:hypothetical protein
MELEVGYIFDFSLKGCVQAAGSYKDLIACEHVQDILAPEASKENKNSNKQVDHSVKDTEDKKQKEKNRDKPDNKENLESRETGNVKMESYGAYFKSAGLLGPIVVLVLFAASQALLMTSDFCVLAW